MSDEQYTWTPISVDDVVINETYVRATRRDERGLVTEGLVMDRDREYLSLMTDRGPMAVDTDYRDLERRDPIPAPEFPAPVVGETFTRTKDRAGQRDVTDCVVESVHPIPGLGWRVEYVTSSTISGIGTIIVHRDGTVTNTSGGAPGRFLRPVTGAWVQPPVTWHPVDFAQLRNGDDVRVTFTNARGETSVKEGTVTLIQGARVSFRDKDGVGHAASSLRTFEISNRVPEPVPVLSERYPTIHHLKAAIFDVAVPNYKNGTWCSDTNDFLRELDIVDNLYQDAGLKDQAEQVQELITRIQSESASSRGISVTSLEKAFETLGIPRSGPQTPRQKMMTVTVAVPVEYDTTTVADWVNSRTNNMVVENVEES